SVVAILSQAAALTEIYPLSLHDALPIFAEHALHRAHRRAHDLDVGGANVRLGTQALRSFDIGMRAAAARPWLEAQLLDVAAAARSEEHTSELQSRENLVCRLLLEKKKAQ